MLHRHFTNHILIYERIYPNSISQQKREESFLTEYLNVKSMVFQRTLQENEFKKFHQNKNKSNLINLSERFENKDKLQNFQSIINSSVRATQNTYFKASKDLIFESKFESGNLCLAFKALFIRLEKTNILFICKMILIQMVMPNGFSIKLKIQ